MMKITEKTHGCSEGGHAEGWCDSEGRQVLGEMKEHETLCQLIKAAAEAAYLDSVHVDTWKVT